MADEWSRAVPRRSAEPDPEEYRPSPAAPAGRRAMSEPEEEPQLSSGGRRFAPAEEEPAPEEPTPEQPWRAPSSPTIQEKPRKPRRRWLIVLLIIMLVIALGVTSWFFVLRDHFASPSTSSPEPDVTTVEPSPTPTPDDPENTEGAPEAVGELQVNDTTLTAPPGWHLYGDESIEDGRRVIRLSHAETDVRLQVATIADVQGDVAAACESLSAAQQESFTEVTPTPTLGIGIDPAQGSGVTCGFHGTRTGDGVAATVTFTVVLRISDGHLLSLRSMIPDSLEQTPASEQARGELAAMNCAAGRNFQVTLPLC
ncbi:MAG: hypothetical protein Q4D96_07135 [Propionibacteriaceae bacterium]|nr:hypothetical protein [Propionibacteriaceae bacterium]